MKKIQDIFKILPHRYPFLLVDKIVESDGTRRRADKTNTTAWIAPTTKYPMTI